MAEIRWRVCLVIFLLNKQNGDGKNNRLKH